MRFLFRPQAAVNLDGTPVQSGTFAAYAPDDTLFATPLPVYAPGGSMPIGTVSVTDYVSQAFEVDDHQEVFLKSGDLPAVAVISAGGALAAAVAAKDDAEAAQALAEDASSDAVTARAQAETARDEAVAARDEAVAAAEFVTAPSDAQVAAYVGGTGGATRAALDGRYAPDGGGKPVGKGELVLNVADYGAVGDGATDDTTALQAAFAAARAENARLRFGYGKTYIVAGMLNPTGVLVEGFGATLKVLDGVTQTWSVFQPTGAFGLRDLLIDLNKANTTDPGADTQGIGIYLYNAAGWSGRAVLRDVTVTNGHRPGIRIGTASSITDALSAPDSAVTLDNVEVSGCRFGVYMLAVAGATLINPRVTGASADGIWDYLSRDTQIDGGRVSGSGGHGIVTQYSHGFAARGPRVNTATGSGIVVGGGSTTITEARRFTIADAIVTGCTLNGISVDPTKSGAAGTSVPVYGAVSGCVATDNGIHGIYLHKTQYLSAVGNTCQGNANGGIATDGRMCAISGNTLVANAYGLKFLGTSGDCGYHSVGRNTVVDNTTANYYFDSLGATGTPLDLYGSGTPEGAVAAPVGSTFARTDGGAGTSLYVKQSGTGNTGWVGK